MALAVRALYLRRSCEHADVTVLAITKGLLKLCLPQALPSKWAVDAAHFCWHCCCAARHAHCR